MDITTTRVLNEAGMISPGVLEHISLALAAENKDVKKKT